MKLLGWMHRKFRQNTSETQKGFSIGFADDIQCYQKGIYGGSKAFTKAPRDNYRRNSFTGLEVSRVEEEQLEEEEEEEENALSEIFHGFLAIGTLGTEQFTSDPATPTFSISHIAEKETEVTENELKLINDELEKVLGDDMSVAASSSGRNSHVSAGRISHCSTITLSGKPPIESGDMCPLQSYLFGSAVETVKKEQRTSLGELFQKTKQADECGTKRINEKENDKSAVHAVKKLLKKKLLIHKSTAAAADSTTPETKLHKILHIFNRKVHPETWHKPKNHHEMKNSNLVGASNYCDGLLRPSAEDIIIYPQHQQAAEAAVPKENTWAHNKHHAKSSGGDTTELWVKTDADYLVLEL